MLSLLPGINGIWLTYRGHLRYIGTPRKHNTLIAREYGLGPATRMLHYNNLPRRKVGGGTVQSPLI